MLKRNRNEVVRINNSAVRLLFATRRILIECLVTEHNTRLHSYQSEEIKIYIFHSPTTETNQPRIKPRTVAFTVPRLFPRATTAFPNSVLSFLFFLSSLFLSIFSLLRVTQVYDTIYMYLIMMSLIWITNILYKNSLVAEKINIFYEEFCQREISVSCFIVFPRQ